MRKIPALLLILLLPGLLSAQTMTSSPSRPLVLTHLTVIDVTRGRAKSDMTVMIEGEHIVALGKDGKIKAPQGAQVIDATEKYLIPGLWDMVWSFDVRVKETTGACAAENVADVS